MEVTRVGSEEEGTHTVTGASDQARCVIQSRQRVRQTLDHLLQPLPLGVGHPKEGEPKGLTADPLHRRGLDHQRPVHVWRINAEFQGEARRQCRRTFHPTSTRREIQNSAGALEGWRGTKRGAELHAEAGG